jgi:hypothetical protein
MVGNLHGGGKLVRHFPAGESRRVSPQSAPRPPSLIGTEFLDDEQTVPCRRLSIQIAGSYPAFQVTSVRNCSRLASTWPLSAAKRGLVGVRRVFRYAGGILDTVRQGARRDGGLVGTERLHGIEIGCSPCG